MTNYTGIAGSSFMFGARTGGFNDNHWIDDVCITLGSPAPPTVALQTACLETTAGATLCLQAAVSGTTPLSFQWFRQGFPVPNATNSTYCLTNAQPPAGGGYYLVVSNSAGMVTSIVEQVTVIPSSGPALVSPTIVTNGFCLTFPTYPNLMSFVEYKNTLTDTNWLPLAAILGYGNVQSFCDPALTNSSRFYRVRLTPAGESFPSHYLPPDFSSSIGAPTSSCGCSSPDAPSGSAVGGNAQDNAMGNVLLHTGEFTQRAVDLAVSGRGFQWRFERAYRSGWTFNGPVGYGWDFNYNRRLYRDTNGNVLRLDGLGRADRYLRNGNSFQSPTGIYNILTNHSDHTYEEIEAHGTRWFYSAPNCLGVSALVQVLDRLSNSLTFQYNAAGQLTNAIDSVGRSYSYQYNADGRLVRVADFTGRATTLAYDQNGDLVSVTSPPVSGTPNGNDFPAGKTVAYSYSSGFPDPRLNHNLLTVTAPKQVAGGGGPRISVSYDNNPGSSNVDRVVSLNMGGTISNRYAIFQDTVTDRNGNVTEYRFNQLGNVLRSIRFTRGLRPGEPPAYTNLFQYNKDGEVTNHINPEGDFIAYTYGGGSPDRRGEGNLATLTHYPGPRGAAQSSISRGMGYEAKFNLVTSATDFGGHITAYTYDQFGNATNVVYADGGGEDFQFDQFGQVTNHTLPSNGTTRRRDTMTYTTNGYLQSQIMDAGGFNLTTTYEYDAVGNLVRTVDPRGHDATNIVNSLNQVVREISRETSNGSGIRYVRDTYYDANNNVTRVDVENRDETGAFLAPPSYGTTYTYDILDAPLTVTEGSSASATGYGYDSNRNRTNITVGVSGPVATIYDERDLAFRETRAAVSTTQLDYDGDGNLLLHREGLEDTNGVRVAAYAYDGLNRRITTTDAMGNVTTNSYDANGNLVHTAVLGELVDIPGGVNNVRLSETTYSYDALNRLTNTDMLVFDPQTQLPIGPGQARSGTVYSQSGQVVSVSDANGHVSTTTYDTANRPLTVTDARGNTSTYSCDADGNVTGIIQIDLSDLGNPSQTFTNRWVYDNQDRLVATLDNLRITNRFGYDSRGDRTLTTDGRGNKIHFTYDGLNRPIRTVRDLTTTGDGSGASAGTITTREEWDASSRLTAQTDDNSHATTYAYDGRDQQTGNTMADTTGNNAVYDVHGNVTTNTDANGTTVINYYDLLNRLTNRAILRAAGVLGSTNESYRYDGLSHLVLAQDDVSSIGRAYDSLGRVLRETNNLSAPAFPPAADKIVTTFRDAVGNATFCAYPGGRQVTTIYDPLNRKQTISDQNGLIASYFYIGASRVERRVNNNITWCDDSYDAARRIVAITNYSSAGGVTNVIDARTYGWDANYNKNRHSDVRAGGPLLTRFYTNDSADRLIGTLVAGPGTNVTRTYRLDGVGNRCNINASSSNCTYLANMVNEYSSTPADARGYDANGNLTSVAGGPSAGAFVYDYRNLMVQASPASSSPAFYTYDVLGRRVQKIAGGTTNRFVYFGWQEIEEQDAGGVPFATYAFGNYIDGVLNRRSAGTNFFYHADDNYNVVAITDGSGNVQERYDYDDYGAPSFFSPLGSPLPLATSGNPLLFTGRRFDSETACYHFRARCYEPATGTFRQRDPAQTMAPANLYEYAASSPQSGMDPFGLWRIKKEGGERADANS